MDNTKYKYKSPTDSNVFLMTLMTICGRKAWHLSWSFLEPRKSGLAGGFSQAVDRGGIGVASSGSKTELKNLKTPPNLAFGIISYHIVANK